MAHESFEESEVADILNTGFISVKVDREERPDIDSVYMRACQAITGGGGWPMSVFLTHDKKPFFAGTYFPKNSRWGLIGFTELLNVILEKWANERSSLLRSATDITRLIKTQNAGNGTRVTASKAIEALKSSYDPVYGGFGGAPKFPMPHSLLLLMRYGEASKECMEMASHTMRRMYKGGIFDHIGGGFSRYSTDEKWFAPHFEKMLYDNALLLIAYLKAYKLTGENLFRDVAEKIIQFILREMIDKDGAFFSAQDADSENEEGKYYVFSRQEIIGLLGQADGTRFCDFYDISEEGNFEGSNIVNTLAHDKNGIADKALSEARERVYAYRKRRTKLHTDDKILTSWNGLMIWALSYAYDVLGDERCLSAAKRASDFIEASMTRDDILFASYRDGKQGKPGYIDDYAFYALGLIALHNTTYKRRYIVRARQLVDYAISHFFDKYEGGFYLYEKGGEELIIRPKDVYDGAMPSGNSAMLYALNLMNTLSGGYDEVLLKQRSYMEKHMEHALGHSFYFLAELPQKKIVCVQGKNAHELNRADPDALKTLLLNETDKYRLINGKTTYYVCEMDACLPPSNKLQ